MIRELKKQGYIDALRGYAILAVLVVHSAQQVLPASVFLKHLRNFGIYGVQLFYVVSAFALFMSWDFRSNHELSPIRNFFIRRLFRIAPLFWLVLAAFLLFFGTAPSYWAPNGIAWWQILSAALFVNGFHPEAINAVVPGGWSVAVEMGFYLVLPLLFLTIGNLRAALVFLALSLVLRFASIPVVESLFTGVFPPAQQYLVKTFQYQNLLSQLPVFAMGIVVYFLGRDFSTRPRLAIMGAALLAVMLALVVAFPTAPVIHHHLTMGALLALATFVLAGFHTKRIANRWVVFIGKISYSMYLTQFLVIYTFRDHGVLQQFPQGDLGWFAYFLIATGVIVAVSTLTYRYIELPGIRLGQRLIARLERDDEKHAAQAVA
jgi:peptidoglycan/LPS O-acetylase OafA/YrhL